MQIDRQLVAIIARGGVGVNTLQPNPSSKTTAVTLNRLETT